jgi:tRNA pseudouridine55 synthase
MVSAVKIGGVPLYKLARKGQVVEREPRFVRVFDYNLQRIEVPEVDFRVVCSKGFYVRTYAHDIGERLGCGGHLSALRRTRSGKFTLDRAVTVDDLKNAPREDLLKRLVTLAEISLMRGA